MDKKLLESNDLESVAGGDLAEVNKGTAFYIPFKGKITQEDIDDPNTLEDISFIVRRKFRKDISEEQLGNISTFLKGIEPGVYSKLYFDINSDNTVTGIFASE